MKKIIVALAGCVVSVALVASAATGASNRATLAGSVPSWAKSANFKSSAKSSDSVNFRVYLNLRDQAQAEALARAVTNPASASYGKFLTPGQFQSQFAPTQADVANVKSWLQSQGFTIDYVPGNNHYVAAEGSVAQVQTAFGTTLNMYAVAGKVLRAPSSNLTVPSSLGNVVAGVIGVDQSAALVQTFTKEPAAPPSAGFRNSGPCSTYWDQYDTSSTAVSDPASGVGSTLLPDYQGSSRPFAPCGYYGKQLQNAYGVGSYIDRGQDGTGVTVAVIDAYASPTIGADLAKYFAPDAVPFKGVPAFKPGQFTQSVAPGIYRRPENVRQDPQGWYGEETLDIEAVHTMAPGAKVVYVAAPNNYQDLDAALNHVVERRLADIVTNSYGWNTEFLPYGFIKPYNDTMLQGVLEGMGLYFSSGDDGDETFGGPASTATPDWPATSPWVTAVGGTSLAAGTAANPTQYLWETGWGTMRNRLNCSGLLQLAGNAWCDSEVYLYGSGGGTSRLFAEPWYQSNSGVVPTPLTTRWSSTPHRVIPDISAVGDPNTGMLIGQTQTFSDGTYYDQFRIGGTSLSSPLMAGIMAVAQQVRGQRIGFANPLIYALPSGAFHDVLHRDDAVVRADFANSENGSDGILFSTRSFDQTFTLHTTAGYDDVTGRGTPNDDGSYIASLATAKPVG